VKSRTRRAMAQLRARLGPETDLVEPAAAPSRTADTSADR